MSLLILFGSGGGGPPPSNKLGGVVRAQRMSIRRPWRPAMVMIAPMAMVGPTHYSLLAEAGAYTLTGNAAGLKAGRQIAAGLGTFTLTGNAATLTYSGSGGAYTLVADTGTFTLTGNAAALRVARMLAAATGGFTLTGSAAGLAAARVLTAAGGSFTLTGNDATLTYTGAGGSFTLTAEAGSFTLTGNAAGLRVARQMIAAAGGYTLTGQAAGLTLARRLTASLGTFTLTGVSATLDYSGALSNLGQYVIQLLGLDRWLIADHTLTRYTISEPAMPTTVTTASAYLWLTEDQEAEFEFSRKNATTGVLEPATGLTGMTVHIAATAGGSAIGALTFNLTERGTTGIYYAVMDTATLVAGLSAASYPDGTAIYLVVSKSGDIASRNFRKIIKRQRIGDG